METVFAASFFEVYEIRGEMMEFCVDKKRFMKMMLFGKSQKWVRMLYEEETRKMSWRFVGRSGRITAFECVFYYHDYGAGYVVRQQNFTNHIIMVHSEFGNLLGCFAEWESATFGVYTKRKFEKWEMVFIFGDSCAVKCRRSYWGRDGTSSVEAMESCNFFLPEVHDLPHRYFEFAKIRVIFNKLNLEGDALVSLCLGAGEPLEVTFHVCGGVCVKMFVAPQSIEERKFF